MTKTLWCIRHGTALHNILDKQIGDKAYTDYTDTPLVEKGQQESLEFGKKWENLKNMDIVFVSPLTRTLQTATNIFNGTDKKIIAIEDILEFPQGVHYCNKRKKKSELINLFPNVDFSLIDENPKYWRNDVQETVSELQERIQTFFVFAGKRDEKTMCVIAHSSFLKGLLFGDVGNWDKVVNHCYPYEFKLIQQ
jgi:broad specificity phosphatase PhoE